MENPQGQRPVRGTHVLVIRSVWMVVGPIAMVIGAVEIVRFGRSWLTPADGAFAGIIAMTLAARWYDFRFGTRTTTNGWPDSRREAAQYSMRLIVAAMSIWIGSNLISMQIGPPG